MKGLAPGHTAGSSESLNGRTSDLCFLFCLSHCLPPTLNLYQSFIPPFLPPSSSLYFTHTFISLDKIVCARPTLGSGDMK